uniref:Uncharacterized protein n=1 Tax=Ganoderma boninense TaxID=34458 RepID=A0A5K1JSY2_9APHY|nr:Uncharacterized protein [Ganoderma boninense]
MGSLNQPLSGQIPQMQPSQQLGFPTSFWQPCPSQVMFNPFMTHQCPVMEQALPQQQNSFPQVLNTGGQAPWFNALVTAVSTEIKTKGINGVVGNADPRSDATGASSWSGDLSPEDEEGLFNALKEGAKGGLTVQHILKELSQNHGHEEIGRCLP